MHYRIALLFVLIAFAAPVQAAEEPIRVQLTWTHQAQFAGFYVAETKGFYRREGLSVELIEGAPGILPASVVAEGRADVAVAWLTDAFEARKSGRNVVNIAQVLQHPGMSLICRNDAGIENVDDLAGKRIGIWGVGDEFSLRALLLDAGLRMEQVELLKQAPHGADLVAGRVDCATAMIYNEYWSILEAGFSPADLLVVDFGDSGHGLLEDGLYANGAALADPEESERLARFLRATAAGWDYARRHPEDALAMVMAKDENLSAAHQQRMLASILRLIDPARPFGLLDLDDFEVSADIVGGADEINPAAILPHSWTYRIWTAAGLDPVPGRPLSRATAHYLEEAVNTAWFYIFGLIGTAAFATAGFMQAQKRRYDLWGAFILAFLPAVGGGTLRDLLLGGDRHPPFIFKDPAYIYTVLAVVACGAVFSWLMPQRLTETETYTRFMRIFDALGLAAFTIIGAKVALLAGLDWYWVAFCSALSCAGGGMLLDIVTGREPRTFQGEPYEELAIVGGLFFYFWLLMINRHEHAPELVSLGVMLTLVLTFSLRLLSVMFGIRSFRLGGARSAPSDVS